MSLIGTAMLLLVVSIPIVRLIAAVYYTEKGPDPTEYPNLSDLDDPGHIPEEENQQD